MPDRNYYDRETQPLGVQTDVPADIELRKQLERVRDREEKRRGARHAGDVEEQGYAPRVYRVSGGGR